MSHTLGELAQRFGLELRGEPDVEIHGVCSLAPGQPGRIGFLNSPRLRQILQQTAAAAVIVGPADSAALAGPGLIARDPYLAYAKIAVLYDTRRRFAPQRHASAVVASDARIGEGVYIGPQVVIEEGAVVGDRCYLGPASVVMRDARIGADTRLQSRVFIHSAVRVGQRCSFDVGAVIGSRGFGNAMSPDGWVEVPQLGSVVIGDDVEVGANTTIDRGAIDDTVIEDGVKLDNLIQIAHNCHVGAHTAIAACTGIAGSTRIGRRCMIGGAASINGHIEIGDDVIILGFAMVTHSLLKKGVYGSGLPAAPVREWRRTVGRVRRLGPLEDRLKILEQRLGIRTQDDGDHEPDASD